MTTYFDANLCHDMITGRAVTGVLHFPNQTPVDYYIKKHSIVEATTYRLEFMVDLRTTLKYLGVRIYGPTYMFGHNKTVVNSSILPKARLHKRHVLLSFYQVQEAIAVGDPK